MPRTNSTAALAAKFAPEAGLEAEVAAMLAAAGASNAEALAEAEESLALNVSPQRKTMRQDGVQFETSQSGGHGSVTLSHLCMHSIDLTNGLQHRREAPDASLAMPIAAAHFCFLCGWCWRSMQLHSALGEAPVLNVTHYSVPYFGLGYWAHNPVLGQAWPGIAVGSSVHLCSALSVAFECSA